jgi:hypothetical protein
METNNPQIEAHLNELTKLCCEAFSTEMSTLGERTEPLLKSLLMSGYQRHAKQPLRTELEARVRAACPEPAMHRGAEINGVTEQIQKKYEDLLRWESRQPEGRTKAKSANISSATDA